MLQTPGMIRGIDLPDTTDANVPEEYSDLLHIEAAVEDQELPRRTPGGGRLT
jgi:hypothetical protein